MMLRHFQCQVEFKLHFLLVGTRLELLAIGGREFRLLLEADDDHLCNDGSIEG